MGRRIRIGALLGVLVFAALAGFVQARDVDRSARKVVKLTVTARYHARRCRTGVASVAPLAGVDVRLVGRRGFDETRTTNGSGRFTISVPRSAAPLAASTALSGPGLSVTPANASKPYRLDLGRVKSLSGTKQAAKLTVADGPPSGAASIWTILRKGVRVGRKVVSPQKLPSIRARWRYASNLKTWLGDEVPSAYDDTTNEIVVGGKPKSNRDEWEAFPLLHEYGHHVLVTAANPGKKASGAHEFTTVHPGNPSLPWSEGFANAFAAIALKKAKLTLGCKVAMNLGARPATPAPAKAHLAQYNETATAGALWYLTKKLGGGNVQTGLAKLVPALRAHRVAGHPPQSLREARDALVTGGLEDGRPSLHRAFDAIFAREKIGWGVALQVKDGDGRTAGRYAWYKYHLVLTGPGGTSCELRGSDLFPGYVPIQGTTDMWRGKVGDTGGLDYTWEDDCLVSGGSADPSTNLDATFQEGSLLFTFPYLANEAHHSGDYTLYAQYVCKDAPGATDSSGRCTADRKARFRLFKGPGVGKDGVRNVFFTAKIGPTRTKIATFTATGECTITASSGDCTT